MALHTSELASSDPSALVMSYCFLCDEAGPHFTARLGEELVFQCHACFATHADRLPPAPEPHGRRRADLPVSSGRHRLV